MYHEISISDLSKPQFSKLLKGHPVRVKMGSGLKLNVSSEQKKKLMSAEKKGKGMKAVFHKGIGFEIDIDGVIYLVLNEGEIIAVLP